MNLLCSVWCCVVTHCKQPLCALLICDCSFSYQSYIISYDFSTNRLRPCLFAHIDCCRENSDRVIWNVFHFLWSLRCVFDSGGAGVRFLAVAHTIRRIWENVVRDLITLPAQSSTDTHPPSLCFHLTAFPPSCQWLCFASNIHILKHCSSQLVVVNMSFLNF